jgi:hypothetical protein
LRSGRITVLIPARLAASTFSLIPPTGSTLPVSVTSPVIASAGFTGRPDRSEAIAAVIVTPALGPSLGMAPAGTWTWISVSFQNFGSIPKSDACART